MKIQQPSTSGTHLRQQNFIANCLLFSSYTVTLLLLVLCSFTDVTTGQHILLQDVVYTKSQSPYYFREDIYIPSKIKLTIQPGVVLKFDHNKGIIVKGTLDAQVSRLSLSPSLSLLRNVI